MWQISPSDPSTGHVFFEREKNNTLKRVREGLLDVESKAGSPQRSDFGLVFYFSLSFPLLLGLSTAMGISWCSFFVLLHLFCLCWTGL